MKTLLSTLFVLFFSLSLCAQNTDPKAEARIELSEYIATIAESNPELALTMKEQNSLLRLLVAQNLHLKSIDDGMVEKAVSEAERAELVRGYKDRLAALLGPERVELLKKAAETAEELPEVPAEQKK